MGGIWRRCLYQNFSWRPGRLAGQDQSPVERAKELRPYRTLDPSRLELFGKASWDIEPHLSDLLWMAFVEPASLIWTTSLEAPSAPDSDKEKYKSVHDLAKLRKDPAMRFFNAYKNHEVDRMIGDRGSRNYREGRLAGVSSGLPTPQCLFDLEINPYKQRLSICRFESPSLEPSQTVCGPAGPS